MEDEFPKKIGVVPKLCKYNCEYMYKMNYQLLLRYVSSDRDDSVLLDKLTHSMLSGERFEARARVQGWGRHPFSTHSYSASSTQPDVKYVSVPAYYFNQVPGSTDLFTCTIRLPANHPAAQLIQRARAQMIQRARTQMIQRAGVPPERVQGWGRHPFSTHSYSLSLIHIRRSRRQLTCRSRWSPNH